MNCAEIKEKYSDYIDCCLGECQGDVESHLAACPNCRNELGQLRKMVGVLNCLPQVDLSPNFLVKLNERLDQGAKGWFAKWTESFVSGFQTRALAMAATVALVVLSVFYFNSQNSPIPVAGNAVAVRPTAVAQPSPVIPAAGIPATAVASRPFAETGPVHSVALTSEPLITEDASAESYIRARNPNQIPYMDKVVLLKAANPSSTASQVRRAAALYSGQYLDYTEKIIIVKVPIETADLFLQALDTMGSTDIIAGPIDQGLPFLLFQVIVIPNR